VATTGAQRHDTDRAPGGVTVDEHEDEHVNEDPPLVPGGCDGDVGEGFYDESGELMLAASLAQQLDTRLLDPRRAWLEPIREIPGLTRPVPCPLGVLDGSWFLEITGPFTLFATRGALRIEARNGLLRASADMYTSRPFIGPWATLSGVAAPADLQIRMPPSALRIRRNWYPTFPQAEYAWYLRSTGVSYVGGVLLIAFTRHLWSRQQRDFVSTDQGWLRLVCHEGTVKLPTFPRETKQLSGTAMIGGKQHDIRATKTSPYYRGCVVEVDAMVNRNWVASATTPGGTVSFTGVYRAHGLDFRAVVNDTNVPEDANLTVAELHALLTAHRSLASPPSWHLWLLVGSRLGTGGTLGLMFDDVAPHREGAVGFADPNLGSSSIIDPAAQNRALGDVPAAFLRTLIHEAGHAFNLFHPKHDVHAVPIGTTIMNQTGDVMGFASTTDRFPGNATFAFNEHNATSLVHSPDPQVAPGWRDFGWGHGNLSSGVPVPTDVAGLTAGAEAEDLRLELSVPPLIVRGEVVVADVTVTNTGDAPRSVTERLNLAEDDLYLHVGCPSGSTVRVRDVVLACSLPRMVELQPGESISAAVQLFFTSEGFTFDQPGFYELTAELDIGDGSQQIARSEPVRIEVQLPVEDDQRRLADLTMDDAVGRSVSFGDYGADEQIAETLATVATDFAASDTGAVLGLVLINGHDRDTRDLMSGDVASPARRDDAGSVLDQLLEHHSSDELERLAGAAVSPLEPDAPVLDDLRGR
jgi:hypothetical protein